ncbi:MAG: hypothetical protein SVR94_03190 [Pseudomonadota bacterium]|nr:hypothetical protein [Pseudomonadota bacterium]
MKKLLTYLILSSFLVTGVVAKEESAPTNDVEKTAASKKAEDKTAEDKKDSPEITALKKTIASYIKTWQSRDFKKLHRYESWQGGAKLDEIDYIKNIDTDFRIDTWQITQVKPMDDDKYRVLILVTHNPPKQIAGLVPPGTTVNSTLNQWWQKKGDKFVHLFHVERQQLTPKLPQNIPTPPKAH